MLVELATFQLSKAATLARLTLATLPNVLGRSIEQMPDVSALLNRFQNKRDETSLTDFKRSESFLPGLPSLVETFATDGALGTTRAVLPEDRKTTVSLH
jgi:hypothetical protein